MREVNVDKVTENIKEMCIEANHFLTDDMKKVFKNAVVSEKSPLGKQVLNQLNENLDIAANDMMPGYRYGCSIHKCWSGCAFYRWKYNRCNK